MSEARRTWSIGPLLALMPERAVNFMRQVACARHPRDAASCLGGFRLSTHLDGRLGFRDRRLDATVEPIKVRAGRIPERLLEWLRLAANHFVLSD